MSFWNFLGELALFNMVCNWFSGKPKSKPQSSAYPPLHDHIHDAEYEARVEKLQREIVHSKTKIAEYQRIIDSERDYCVEDADADELQDRIDELEDQLGSCDVMSDRYDRIQDEIDRLQYRLDDIEDSQDMNDDIYCDLHYDSDGLDGFYQDLDEVYDLD